MGTYIRKRTEGPVWLKTIFIQDDGVHIRGILEGNNMNSIKVYKALSPNQQKGEIISEGRLRVVPSYDQGWPASYLIYIPNRKKYPKQEKEYILRVV